MWNVLGNLLSRSRRGRRLLIVTYHRVLAEPDELFDEDVDAQLFARQLELFATHFNVMRLDEAVARLERGDLPARALTLTFDDGYADNHTVALPLLRKFGLSGAFFVASGFLDGRRMWNDTIIEALRRERRPAIDLEDLGVGRLDLSSLPARRSAIQNVIRHLKHEPAAARDAAVARLVERVGQPLPPGLMMTTRQVRELADANMLVGAHTVSHPILAATDLAAAEKEIADGRDQLQAITGAPVDAFAYPNGRPQSDYRAEHVQLVRRLGFRSAVTTAWGYADGDSNRWQLPRVTPWEANPGRLHLRLLRAYREPQKLTA
ncbi:MAG TPA: polysaccharide deacetylase family protein [Steroidobacteraceae bacterium]|nr:polysaccharide deacetylase family protein [Steroidobacteraceae bacterium]